MKAYKGPYSKVNGVYGGIDDLGRALTTDASLPLPAKPVGRHLLLSGPGKHGLRGPYDNSKIRGSTSGRDGFGRSVDGRGPAAAAMRIIIGENPCSVIIRCMTNGLSGSIFRC